MSWFSGLVLYAVIWFLTLFVVLPLRLVTQAEAGRVVPGTPEGAPTEPQMRRRLVITTIAATAVFAVVAGVILSGAITIADLDALYRR
jgi:predicted secreted protein